MLTHHKKGSQEEQEIFQETVKQSEQSSESHSDLQTFEKEPSDSVHALADQLILHRVAAALLDLVLLLAWPKRRDQSVSASRARVQLHKQCLKFPLLRLLVAVLSKAIAQYI